MAPAASLLALALAGVGSHYGAPTVWFLSVMAAILASSRRSNSRAGFGETTPIAACAAAFALWVFASNAWISASYNVAGTYHAAILVAGLMVGRLSLSAAGHRLFVVLLAFTVLLSAWAVWQRTAGTARPQALFETPATLAAVLNLALVPGLAVLALGKRGLLLSGALVLLSAGLAATASRGGWLALGIALLAVFVLARRAGRAARAGDFAWVIGVLAGGFALAWLVPLLWHALASSGAERAAAAVVPQISMVGPEAAQSSWARIGMFELALSSMGEAGWLTGYGYLGFYYLMEMGRAGIATYETGMTYFVHNDYLQVLLELGVPGLLLLVAIVILPLAMVWRAAPLAIARPRDRMALVALVGMIVSMAAHAMVDYPFYVPVCLLIYGAALGMLESLLVANGWARAWHLSFSAIPERVAKAARAAVATLVAFVLVAPVAAEAAAAYAHESWRAGKGQHAAYWFGVARTLQPRDWRYHWYAGQFWFSQAVQQRKAEPANLADRAFASGMEANPREPRNLAGRISTHLTLRPHLAAPADRATLLAWADRVVEQAPFDPSAKRLRAAVLHSAEESKKAQP